MEASFKKDQIVRAKVSGYPWWPGFVKTALKSDSFEVVFFGDFSRANLAASKIREYHDVEEPADKRNKKLQLACKVAERILAGKTSLEAERGVFQPKSIKKSLTNAEKSCKSSRRLRPLSHVDDSELLSPDNSLTGDVFSRRPSESKKLFPNSLEAELGLMQPASRIELGPALDLPFNELSRTYSTALAEKPSRKLLQPREASPEAHRSKRLSKLSWVDEEENEQSPEQKTKSKERPAGKAGDEIKIQVTPANTTSSLQKALNGLEKDAQEVKALEEKLEGVWLGLRNHDALVHEAIVKLGDWFREFAKNEKLIDKMFTGRIGGLLMLLQYVCSERSKTQTGFQLLLLEINQLIDKVKLKLIENFFRPSDERLDKYGVYAGTSFTDKWKESFPSFLKQQSIFSSPSTPGNKAEGFAAVELPNTSEMQLEEAKAEAETKGSSEHLEIEPKVAYRVCKKIAKVIYLKGGKTNVKKHVCEDLANHIESLVKSASHNEVEYKQKVIKFLKRLDQKPHQFLEPALKHYKDASSEFLLEFVQNYITRQL